MVFCHWEEKEIQNKNMGNDNKPLNILIRNIAQSYIIDIMQTIKTFDNKPIKKDDIIEINTDSLYIKNAHLYNTSFIKNDPDNWKGWKLNKGYKETQLTQTTTFYNDNELIPEKYFYETNNNTYNFNIELAGGGKTTRIIKEIQDKLKKDKNYSYIIMSSFNDFITDYRKNKLNASTIAHYTFNNKNIKETNIYIDECGICDISQYLFLLRHSDKTINFYGDYSQLQPVKSKKINIEFLKSIATIYNTNWTNYRNTFSKEFYEELINLTDQTKIKELLLTYNSPMHTAEIVIGFFNKTIDKYNKEMLEHNNKQFNNKTISPNIPIINTENKLEVLNIETQEKELIYNRHSFIIKN